MKAISHKLLALISMKRSDSGIASWPLTIGLDLCYDPTSQADKINEMSAFHSTIRLAKPALRTLAVHLGKHASVLRRSN